MLRNIRTTADTLRLMVSVILLAAAIFVGTSTYQSSQVELPISFHNAAIPDSLFSEILTLVDSLEQDGSPVFLLAVSAEVCPPALVEMEEYAAVIRESAPTAVVVPLIADTDSVAAARLIAMGNWHHEPIYMGLNKGLSTLLSKDPLQTNQLLVLDSSMRRHLASVPMPNNSVTPFDMKRRVIHQLID